MERGSSHHTPRVDDELAAEVEPMLHGGALSAREREDLEPEVPAADEEGAQPDLLGPDADPEIPAHGEVLARSELARWLLPSSFPARAATLAAVARKQGAPDDVVERLEAVTETRIFETVGELWTALGGVHEHRTAPEPEPAVDDVAGVEPTATRAPDELQPVVEAVLDATAGSDRAPSSRDEPTDQPVVVAALAPTGAQPLPSAPDSAVATVAHLVTIPPRIAIATVRGVGHVLRRGIAAVTGSDHPSN